MSEVMKDQKRQSVREFLRTQGITVKSRKKIINYYDHSFQHRTLFNELEMASSTDRFCLFDTVLI